MSIAERLDEIEARANAATKGPWTRWKHPLGTKTMDFVSAPSLRNDDAIPFGVADDLLGRDAEFIAAARQDVPALVNALRAVITLVDDAENKWINGYALVREIERNL